MSDLGDLGIAEARHLAAERPEPLALHGYRNFGKVWHQVAKNYLAGLTRSPPCQKILRLENILFYKATGILVEVPAGLAR